MIDDRLLHNCGQNWSNGNLAETSVLLGWKNLGNWKDGSCISLLRNGGSVERKVEKLNYWFAEDWSSQPEKPGRKSI